MHFVFLTLFLHGVSVSILFDMHMSCISYGPSDCDPKNKLAFLAVILINI